MDHHLGIENADESTQVVGNLDETPVPIQEVDGQASATVMAPHLDKYELLGEIGRGGMGVVFKAWQAKPKRIVAIKMILRGQLSGREDVERFRVEADAAAKLDHPGIVPIYEVGQQNALHYFSMGFVDGQSLAKRVAEGPLPARDAAEIVRAVAEAVQYAHDNGVIHRDLKPGNILLDKNGRPRVTDFGLAKLVDGGTTLTGTGQILGTASFMPPEQAAGREVDKSADVYSLGAILYTLLTGRPPFLAATPFETLAQVQSLDPVGPRHLNPNIPSDLSTIALKCLEKSSTQRYASAKEVAIELDRFLTGLPIVARPISALERAWRWSKRKPLIPSVVVTILAISLIAGMAIKHVAENGRAQKLRREVEMAVDAVQNSRGVAVPITIHALKTLPSDDVLKELNFRYGNVVAEKLAVSCALAEYGEVDLDFLFSQIAHAPPAEANNIVTALGHAREASLKAVQVQSAQCKQAQYDFRRRHDDVGGTGTQTQLHEDSDRDLRLKARLAIVALHLGEHHIATEMCQNDRAIPIERTIFVDEFAAWHGDLEHLTAYLRMHFTPGLRSAMCMGMGSIPMVELAPNEAAACQTAIIEMFRTAPDSVTHSASGWALRQWKIDSTEHSDGGTPGAKRDWFTNSLGMTMLRMPHGQFFRTGTDTGGRGLRPEVMRPMQKVTLMKDFYLGDCEVTLGQFRQFVNDAEYSDKEKPVDWQDKRTADLTATIPQDGVSWYDAVLFCNWLSNKEGLTACYERTGKTETFNTSGLMSNNTSELAFETWELSKSGTGYRLPTEAEWEYACRARTRTEFACGTVDLLRQYAVFSSGISRGPAPVGSKMPNGWGVFDMHGNVYEWCYDSGNGAPGRVDVSDPTGPLLAVAGPSTRIARGGKWSEDSRLCASVSPRRGVMAPFDRVNRIGFRIARNAVDHRPPQ